MDRRRYLAAAGTAVLGSLAGCTGGVGVLGSGNTDVTLPEPDRQFDSSQVPYPAWGQRVPDVTLPNATTGGVTNLRAIEGARYHTFFFANCMTLCPILESRLRNIQIHSVREGYAQEVSFYPITFDPERDTPDRLREEARQLNVDREAGNWFFLRPESVERAKAVIDGEFGVFFQKTDPPDGGDGYMYNHPGRILLVNGDGYVERAYRLGQTEASRPSQATMLADLERVRAAERPDGGGGLV
jgi:protein SCO1/2